MYESQQLVKIIDFWKKTVAEDDLVYRPAADIIDIGGKEIVDITGVRRSGKSSILKLLIKKLNLSDFLFINFEDPYFVTHNQAEVIEELVAVYQEYFSRKLKYVFFDEVHVVDHWERAVRKLRDSGKFKIFVTGSSAKLLETELATLLTGRHISYRIEPLSFAEYLTFKGIELKEKKDLILNEKLLQKSFDGYLAMGGFPEIVKTGNLALLKQYYFDILQKDIVMRHQVRQKEVLEKMGVFLISNAAKTVSMESLKRIFGLSFEAVSDYFDYFKEAFLIIEVRQFSYSIKTQQKSVRKIYAVDGGLANAVSFRFSEDKGRMLEQCVFLELRRRGHEVHYYKTGNNKEVDFLVKPKTGKKTLIQVSWDILDENTRKREVDGLRQAMEEAGVTRGLILTYNNEQNIRSKGRSIKIMPVYKWLLCQE